MDAGVQARSVWGPKPDQSVGLPRDQTCAVEAFAALAPAAGFQKQRSTTKRRALSRSQLAGFTARK